MTKHLQNTLLVCALALSCAFALNIQAQIPETGEKIKCIVPIRAITSGKAHWFGYYDKEQFDPTDRYVLAAEVDFEDRSPNKDDVIILGMVDTQDGDKWIPLAESNAWGWQQGCMLQWIPGSDSKIIYNTREGNEHVAVVMDVFTREKKTLPRPVYTLSPDGKHALSVNFARIQDTRPGYGYKGGVDPVADQLAPDGDGIWSLDLESGESELLFSYADIAAIPQELEPIGKHWFNHLLYNTDGSRFIFLHRVHKNLDKKGGWTTRMFTAGADGKDLNVVADHGMVSHFVWRDPSHILAWSREPDTGDAYYLYTDKSDKVEIVGEEVFTRDGHCTYSPDRKWMLTDTYPNKNNMHFIYLYNLEDKRFIELATIYRPKPSSNEWRCDLHPGWSRDGKTVAIDAMYLDGKRQVHLLDVSQYTARPNNFRNQITRQTRGRNIMGIDVDNASNQEPDPEDVLSRMRTAGVQLTPENYHVWFEYVRGQNSQLVSQVERIRQAGKIFTKEINKKLYTEFFDDDGDDLARRLAQKRTHAVLREALSGILTSQSTTSEYQDSLNDFTEAMTNLTDTKGIAGLVKELVRESNRMAKSSIYYQSQLEDVRAEAEKLNEELEEAMRSSSIDPLTGLWNRKAVDEKLVELIGAFSQEEEIFSVVMIDVDNFRDFNTTYGHQIGDAVLRAVSTTLKESVKGLDFVARYGGEEFIVFFPKTGLENAAIVANKMRVAVESNRKKISSTGRMLDPITISCGVSEITASDDAESVVHRADQALYLAKHSGRNQVKSECDLG